MQPFARKKIIKQFVLLKDLFFRERLTLTATNCHFGGVSVFFGFYDILSFAFLGCPMMNAMIRISKSDLVILLLQEHWILLQCGCTYSF